ncbi:MAG TPA: response regulator transcription factor [Opitutaceae bacterium]|nr:response regulator transcription factor [Opitutaceae bacterium]
MKPITVLLADDHMIVREGFRALLRIETDITVVGEANDGRVAVEMAKKHKPDVVVMDIAMPLLNGLGATRQILEILPATRVLILSAHSDDPYIDRVLAVGAAGFLIKQTSASCLSDAIREIHKGNTFFSPSISKRIHEQKGNSKKVRGAKSAKGLTAREMEVIQLVAEGAANKQVASDLGISIKTVEKHRQHLMDKLNIHDTAGLTRYAIAHGIIESSVQVTII